MIRRYQDLYEWYDGAYTASSNGRVAVEGDGEDLRGLRNWFFIVKPGVLKMASSKFVSVGKRPQKEAESIARLLDNDVQKSRITWSYPMDSESSEMSESSW